MAQQLDLALSPREVLERWSERLKPSERKTLPSVDKARLVVGNPPWITVEVNEALILSEFDPTVALQDASASKILERPMDALAIGLQGKCPATADRLPGHRQGPMRSVLRLT